MRKGASLRRGGVALGLAVGLVALLQLLLAQGVLAHANLVRAEPGPAELETSPGRVAIWFAEPVEAGFSEIRVLNALGERVDNADSVGDPNDRTALTVTLPELPRGIYTVVWRNLSAVDGHTVRGSYVFSVGVPLAEQPETPVVGQPVVQSPLDPGVRWLVLMGIVAVVGGLGLHLVVIRPEWGSGAMYQDLARRLDARMWRLIWAGAILFAVASLGQLLVQSHTLGSPPTSVLTSTGWGRMWLWRMGASLLMAAVLGLAFAMRESQGAHETRDRASHLLRLAGLLAAGGVLFTISLASHSAAAVQVRVPAVFSDYLHLVAVGFWGGGLFHLAVIAPVLLRGLSGEQRRQVLPPLIARFSTLAILCVGTLIITGLYSVWAQVTVPRAVATPYGLTLLVKALLIVPLLFLGALNLLWVRPRLALNGSRSHWLRRFVAGEAVLAVLVLLSVGFMTSMEPARQAAERLGLLSPRGSQLSFTDVSEGARISVKFEPGQVGSNRVLLSLEDSRGKPITNATAVFVTLDYLDAVVGAVTFFATPQGEGQWIVEGAMLSAAGAWKVEVWLLRPDAFDANVVFPFQATPPVGSVVTTVHLSPETGRLLWAAELVLLGLLFMGAGPSLGGWWVRSGAVATGAGAVAAVAGVFVMMTPQFAGAEAQETLRSPFPVNLQSLTFGADYYYQGCNDCHGATGQGDGPMAAGLEQPPRDFRLFVPLRSDIELFRFIADGIPRTSMAGWRNRLNDEQIWHLVNYIKVIAAWPYGHEH